MINSKHFFQIFILILNFNLFAVPIHWMADTRPLNPSGLDIFVNAMAPCDFNKDGITDFAILGKHKDWTWRKLQIFLGQDTETPPYYLPDKVYETRIEGCIGNMGFTIQDIDADGNPNIIIRDATELYDWEIDSTLTLTLNPDTFKDVNFEIAAYTPDNPSFFDIDSDGDLDLLVNNSYIGLGVLNLSFFRNIGNASEPAWEKDSTVLQNATKNTLSYEYISPTMMHVNNDSLVDMLIISITEGIYKIKLFYGRQDSNEFNFSNEQDLPNIEINDTINSIFPYDYNKDGKQDLSVIDRKRVCRIYLATGNEEQPFDPHYYVLNSLPALPFSRIYPFQLNNRFPSFLFVNGYRGWIEFGLKPVRLTPDTLMNCLFYKHTPSETEFTTYTEGDSYKDQLTDFDNNDLPEFIYSHHYMYYSYTNVYENSKPDLSGEWISKTSLKDMIFSQFDSTLFLDINFYDLDNDGDLDFIFREKTVMDIGVNNYNYPSAYHFYENTQEPDSIWKLRPDWKQGLPDTVFNYSTFSDLNQDGDFDMVVKYSATDSLYAFENIGNAQSPAWARWNDAFVNIDYYGEYVPTFYDFYNNGTEELIIRDEFGIFTVYEKDLTLPVEEKSNPVPTEFVLNQNYPNPFNAQTRISFQLAEKATVEINIYDINGRKINCLNNSQLNAGYHQYTWNGTTENGIVSSSGVYFYQVKIKTQTAFHTYSKKMVMIK